MPEHAARMGSRLLTFLVLASACDVALPFASVEDDERAHQLQLECESYRETRFQHGECLVRITELKEATGGTLVDGDSYLRRIWFDGDCIRHDVLEGPQLRRIAFCDGKHTSDDYVPEVPVTIGPLSEYENPFANFGVYHPRWIGTGFNNVWDLGQGRQYRCLNLWEGQPNKGSSIQKEMLDGVEVWKVQYAGEKLVNVRRIIEEFSRTRESRGPFGGPRLDDTPSDDSADLRSTNSSPVSTKPHDLAPATPQDDGDDEIHVFERTYWFAPSQGNALLKCYDRDRFPKTNVDTIHELHAKYAYDEPSDTWFVKTVQTSMSSRGKLETATRIDVEEASFERPLPQTFNVAGFSLPINRRVSDRTLGPFEQEFFWNGNELVRIPSLADAIRPVVVESNTGKRLVLILNAIVLVAFAIYLFRKGMAGGTNRRKNDGNQKG